MTGSARARIAEALSSSLVPGKFMASQLRKPSGRFGRWLLTGGFNRGNAPLIEATLGTLTLHGDQPFLDVGFGGGRALELAATRTRGQLYGVDYSPDMIVAAHRTLGALLRSGRLNLLTADVSDIPLRDGLVNAICTTNTIYFWPDLPAALRELRRVLAPGGQIAFGYTGRDKMLRFDHITRHGFRTFTPTELHEALTNAGFTDLHSQDLEGDTLEGDHVTVGRAPLG